MDKIIKLYSDKFDHKNFYQLAGKKIKNNELINDYYKYDISNPNFSQEEVIISEIGDIRVNLPIWFGKENACKLKIMILGLEPWDTNNEYNIERSGKHVFATPFALEYWTNRNKYFRSFENLIKKPDLLTYFSDVVKDYHVKSSKGESDKFARANFWKKAKEPLHLEFLKSEIIFLNPDFIIGWVMIVINFFLNILVKHFKLERLFILMHGKNKLTKENAWEVSDKQILEIVNGSILFQ